jgi:sigma-B regulation protein RsbU (phosphoserine phosphatase)
VSVTANHRLGHRGSGASLITDPTPQPPGYAIVGPAEVAARLNELYQMSAHGNHYFTMVYGVLDTQEHRLRLTIAGHPGPIIIRPGRDAEVLDVPAFPIGIVQEPEYEEMVIDIEPGDRVYFHSDGINEERNPDGREFGRQRLSAALHELQGVSLNESLDALVQRIIAWRGDDHFRDDISILAFEFGA